MSDQQAQPQDPQVAAPEPESIDRTMEAMLRAARICAEDVALAEDDRDRKDMAAAALALAQAWTVLDPERLAGGDTPQGRLSSVPSPPSMPPGVKDGDGDGQIGEK